MLEPLNGRFAEALAHGVHLVIAVQIEQCQRQDIIGPFPQSRDLNRHHIQPVVQILAEPFFLDQLSQILVCGGDDAYVDGDAAIVPHPCDGLILQGPQELHLKGERNLANLVQKENAVLGGLKETLFSRFVCSGKAAAHISKELTFQQRLRQSAAVDRHEGLVPIGAVAPDVLGHHLFANAGFPQQEHSRAYILNF